MGRHRGPHRHHRSPPRSKGHSRGAGRRGALRPPAGRHLHGCRLRARPPPPLLATDAYELLPRLGGEGGTIILLRIVTPRGGCSTDCRAGTPSPQRAHHAGPGHLGCSAVQGHAGGSSQKEIDGVYGDGACLCDRNSFTVSTVRLVFVVIKRQVR